MGCSVPKGNTAQAGTDMVIGQHNVDIGWLGRP
jgi:hypothetical protein